MEQKGERKSRVFLLVIVLALCAFVFAGLTACGSQGEQGIQGIQGEQGEQGEQGKDGKSVYQIYLDSLADGETPLGEAEWLASLNGNDGISAYEVYKRNTLDNPVKTEAEWLASLKGEQGIQGVAGESGITITALHYVTADKWNICHKLQITYKEAGDESEQTMLTAETVNIVDQNVFYDAADNGELWELIDLHVRRIRLTDNILWVGRKFVDHSTDKAVPSIAYTPIEKYTSIVELNEDVEVDLNGYDMLLEADAVHVGGNASVTFKNGAIKRLNRITTTDASLYGKVVDTDLEETAVNGYKSDGTPSWSKTMPVEHVGRSVYVPATYENGYAVASDKELKRVENFIKYPNSSASAVVAPNPYCDYCSTSTIYVRIIVPLSWTP